MRVFSTVFQSHLDGEVTTLCWAWKLTRTDGVVMGFTDHDLDITVQGISFKASSGFTPGDIENRLGFALDNSAVQGVLSSDAIADTDIRTGVYDNAQIEILRVNWAALDEFGKIWSGKIGEIRWSEGQFEAQLIGHIAELSRSTGRVFSRQCDTEFGGVACGIDRANFPPGTECPHTFLACHEQFQNTENFRGFPHLIGDDAVFVAPKDGDVKDGSSRYTS